MFICYNNENIHKIIPQTSELNYYSIDFIYIYSNSYMSFEIFRFSY